MKRSILKLMTLGVFAAAIAAATTSSRAADTNAPAVSPAASAAPAKFYGPVTAVDTNAMTFTVGDQTFTVTGESQMTKDSKPATLADATVGEPARGSYTTTKGGKLDVTKVRFGKKAGGGKKKKKAEDTTDSGTVTNAPAEK
jgi:hypothetical protein